MIFQHTWKLVLSGKKTQTRRLRKSDECIPLAMYPKSVVRAKRTIWTVGNTYAVQPGRGKAAVAHIRILAIHHQDVRHIDNLGAQLEGFSGIDDFLYTWAFMHDKSHVRYIEKNEIQPILRSYWQRPDILYQAWVLTFELVKP